VQAFAEYKTLQGRPLGSGTRQVRFAKAVPACDTIGNMRGGLHGALRDWKCEGRRELNSLWSKV
jgi:Ser/Thr protein kinase RdoA (MazF antagonist)